MSKRFKTQDYAKFKKLGIRWRKPSGRQSKLRVKKTGSGMLVKIGYGTAKSIRGKIQNADAQLISNVSELNGRKAVIISGSVGLKKAQAILEKADGLGIKVLNSRRIKDGLKSRKEKIKKQVGAVKEEKKEAKETTATENKNETQKTTEKAATETAKTTEM
ncbi:MAG: hypothetical protein HYT72_04900 [Candidatus Aenigmarchaeota archaeon]|nr:hypothetical protein [Candidatus Aenigmarchaeota archaeon]